MMIFRIFYQISAYSFKIPSKLESSSWINSREWYICIDNQKIFIFSYSSPYEIEYLGYFDTSISNIGQVYDIVWGLKPT